ncbi:MAG: hypothetical protein AB1634_18160 [Thermodesulfobacteriota bacterium]
MALFDAYLFVDWSAANGARPQQPARDAVWVGELVPALRSQQETYHRTREAGVRHVAGLLHGHVREGRRVLVGFDFPYGYPAGLAAGLALPAGPLAWWTVWAELAARVQDAADNRNNRFAAAGALNTILRRGQPGPFWGCPVGTSVPNLEARSPGFPSRCASGVELPRLRLVEARLPGTQEAWKLFGAGSVGSQALVGIHHLYRLRRNPDLAPVSRVWPFETGFSPTPSPSQGPSILHAEIWPGVVKEQTQGLMRANPALIRDRAQVRALCAWAAACDGTGTLGQYFVWPAGLDQSQARVCVEQEGWILGAV